MNILLAPDSFKGTMTSVQVAKTMQNAILQEMPKANLTIFPLADGGEGSLEAIYHYEAATWVDLEVSGPLGESLMTRYLRQGSRAIFELAQAAGLTLLEEERRNPGKTSTYGIGEQIKHAMLQGATEVLLCIGGSATNDAGLGIAAALGCQFMDESSSAFIPTGDNLHRIRTIDSSAMLRPDRFRILCDVNNPFVGPEGAVYTYAGQKGADEEDLPRLESNMVAVADLLAEYGQTRIHSLPGAGAAGGVGGGMSALFDAELLSGIDFILDLGMLEALKQTDLVLTGEGLLDRQTVHGKAISGIVRAAARVPVPVVAVCGAVHLNSEEVAKLGLHAAWSIQTRCQSIEEAHRRSEVDLTFTVRQLIRSLQIL